MTDATRNALLGLSHSDWEEIANSDISEDAMLNIGPDGTYVRQVGLPEFTKTELEELLVGVTEKSKRLDSGFYGDDRVAKTWARQMRGILEVLKQAVAGCA